jgi:hypothetical protein
LAAWRALDRSRGSPDHADRETNCCPIGARSRLGPHPPTRKTLLCRAFLNSGGGIRTRDLRVMRCPRRELLRSICSYFVLSGALRCAQIRAVRDLFRDLNLLEQGSAQRPSGNGHRRSRLPGYQTERSAPCGEPTRCRSRGCEPRQGRDRSRRRSEQKRLVDSSAAAQIQQRRREWCNSIGAEDSRFAPGQRCESPGCEIGGRPSRVSAAGIRSRAHAST